MQTDTVLHALEKTGHRSEPLDTMSNAKRFFSEAMFFGACGLVKSAMQRHFVAMRLLDGGWLFRLIFNEGSC